MIMMQQRNQRSLSVPLDSAEIKRKESYSGGIRLMLKGTGGALCD